MRVVILDNEPVQALTDVGHQKHRLVMAHLAAVVHRRRRGAEVSVVVPTAVRVEAGWDRTRPGASVANRLRVADHVLDAQAADLAADIVLRTEVSVADAHVGATARRLPTEDIVVLTSDPGDMVKASAPVPVNAIRI